MSKKSIIILGIDPGYGRLGYAILEKTNNNENLLDYNCVETSSKEQHQERILKITKKIERIIQRYRPDMLSIEKLYFTKNQKTALAVAEIKGILIYLALKNGLKIIEYTPLEVKTAICGYGKATKNQVGDMVKRLINLEKEPKHDDTTDAIALCLTCSARKDYS